VVAYLRAATGGCPYTGRCINLMWTDLVFDPQVRDLTKVCEIPREERRSMGESINAIFKSIVPI
jgi:hypothetical protein